MIRQTKSRPNQQPTSTGRQPLLWAALAFGAGIVTGVYAWRPPLWWLLAWILLTLSAAYLLLPANMLVIPLMEILMPAAVTAMAIG